MLDNLTQMVDAAAWLVPDPMTPWQWDAETEAIVWSDGTTVLFREELAQILERMPGSSLPRAGSLMLLLAACRGKTPDRADVPPRVRAALSALEAIAELPSALKSGVPARAALAAHVLERVPRSGSISADAVIWALRSDLDFTEILEVEVDKENSLAGDLGPLCDPLINLDSETLESLLRTGLPTVPEPAPDLELPLAEQIGNLLSELLNDPELAGLARVARLITAAVALPETLSRAEDETLGGVSDISNRGNIHRLLLSELAHDDDTLATRIAMNEALYLRREPAANHPPSRLVVLLDSGLRMWGVPRVFAAAAGLAFLAKGGKRVQPAVYSSNDGSGQPLALWTKAGLVDYLGSLDTAMEPTTSLAALVKRLQGEKAHVDLVVVTHATTVRSTELLELLPSTGGISAYVAGVNREGHVSIFSRTAHGLRPMNEARIDLEMLFGDGKRRSPMLRDSWGTWPAVFRAQPFPFLLPPDRPVEVGWATAGGGGVCLTSGGNLWRWTHPDRGAVRLPAPRMRGRTLALLHAPQEGCWIAVKHRSAEQRLEIVRWFEERGTGPGAAAQTEIALGTSIPSAAFARGGYLYVVFSDHAVVVSVSTGKEVGRGNFPTFARPIGNRFLDLALSSRSMELGLFFWGGLSLGIPRMHVEHPKGAPDAPIVLMFDRHGYQAPWAVDQEGRIFDTVDPDAPTVPPAGRVVEAIASLSGHRVWLRCVGQQPKLADLERRTLRPCPSVAPQRLFDGYVEPRQIAMRHKFSHIGISAAGGVMLRAHKGYYVEITYLPEGQFVIAPHENSWGVLRQVPFGKPEEAGELGTVLRTAVWRDGSRAFLDDRGLLHLQSRDTRVPEITFVLTESGGMPAWSSDGRKIGPEYFIGDHQAQARDADAISAHVQRFATRIL